MNPPLLFYCFGIGVVSQQKQPVNSEAGEDCAHSMIAAPAFLLRPIGTALPAAFAVAVLDLAHAFERVFFQQLSFRLVSCRGGPFRCPVSFFLRHSFLKINPKKPAAGKHAQHFFLLV